MRQMVVNRTKTKERHSIAFRTKTELEMLDDGYKWRKYGKKKVKSNSNSSFHKRINKDINWKYLYI
nr:probable WRKY transcription factor 51 [Ipomoea batatas]